MVCHLSQIIRSLGKYIINNTRKISYLAKRLPRLLSLSFRGDIMVRLPLLSTQTTFSPSIVKDDLRSWCGILHHQTLNEVLKRQDSSQFQHSPKHTSISRSALLATLTNRRMNETKYLKIQKFTATNRITKNKFYRHTRHELNANSSWC